MRYKQYFLTGSLLFGIFFSCVPHKTILKKSRVQYYYKDLIEINISSLPEVKSRTHTFSWADKEIKDFPVLLRIRNKSDFEIYVEHSKGRFESFFEPSVNLGGTCGINKGRGMADFYTLIKLRPKEERIDTIYYLNCYEYKGKFSVKYKRNILNTKKRILSNENDSIISNVILIP